MRRRGGRGRAGSGRGPVRRRPTAPGERRLSLAEAQFYARVYGPARKGSMAELRRRGCDEHEAEELFAASYAKVMEAVDPLEREFSTDQMVRFVKRACCHRLIDERRRRIAREESPPSSAESPTEPPPELAEERESVAIGREALAMLSERDRLIFTRRHLQGLDPEEILAETPGLSMRTYRKVIQRANARVLDAYGRIQAGERCAEMEGTLLRRYVAGEGDAGERRAVEAHLAHCRACRQARARMRDYLLDVASGALLASSLGAGRAAAVPARLLELASQGAQVMGEASRAARERVREALFRLAGALPGSGADASVSQALGASSWRVASACTATIAAGACVAAGVVPGIGGAGLSARHPQKSPATKQAKADRAPPAVAGAAEYAAPEQAASSSGKASGNTATKRSDAQKNESQTHTASREKTSTPLPPPVRRSPPSLGPSRASPPRPAVRPRPPRGHLGTVRRSPAPPRRRAAVRAPVGARRAAQGRARSSACECRRGPPSHDLTFVLSSNLSPEGVARRRSHMCKG